MLGDGDTVTIASVNKAKPYGAGVVVKKEECIGHVAKRFGSSKIDGPNAQKIRRAKSKKGGL